MPKYLEPNEIVEAIESGFSPLECRVELVGQRLGFCVLDVDGNAVLPIVELACALDEEAIVCGPG
jgi:hypothetical protein